MLRIILHLILLVVLPVAGFAQSTNGKGILYKDRIYDEVVVMKNVSYLGDLKTDRKKKYYLLDVYRASQDSSRLRPLIIWIHGGGFKFGNKKSRGTPLWAKSFARRGYICASVNYRLSRDNTLFNFTALAHANFDAVEDLRRAIAFLKSEWKQFGIDTNTVILAGNSAGAITALHAVYASLQEIATVAGRNDSLQLSNAHNPDRIKAIINYWGAIYDTAWLRNASVPIVSAHGTSDRVVGYSKRSTPVYGSYLIHLEAEKLKIPNSLKSYEGYGHEIQKTFNPFFYGAPARRRWEDIAQFAADFLYENIMK